VAPAKGQKILSRHLVWLRADLRTIDNTALLAACTEKNAEVACVYAITPHQWLMHDVAGVRVDFELRTLAVLKKSLAALNIPLLVLAVPDYKSLPKALTMLAGKHRITAVYANRQYEFNEIARDEAVVSALEKNGITVSLHHDQCAVSPGTILKNDGGPYSVSRLSSVPGLHNLPPQAFNHGLLQKNAMRDLQRAMSFRT